jgi:3-hydroxy-3-methylglutaryl CoA synthase
MYDVVRAFQPNLTAIEITMDCNAGSMGLKEVQERLESARNEVAKLEQAQDRMQAEGHGVLCQCAYCYGRSPVETKFADGRPA